MPKVIKKDSKLAELNERGHNIARFVSFGPGLDFPVVRHICIDDKTRSMVVVPWQDSINILFNLCGSVSIRSFTADPLEMACPVFFDQTDCDYVISKVRELSKEGYYVIVNESVAFFPGMLSGVSCGGLMAGGFGTSPRIVEKGPDKCFNMPREVAEYCIKTIYGLGWDDLDFETNHRTEFSVYPYPVGRLAKKVIIWESGEMDKGSLPDEPELVWPNPISRVIGDKAFGLIIARMLSAESDFNVPHTMVHSKTLPMFSLIYSGPGENDHWVRPCPSVRAPGLLPTVMNGNIFDVIAESEAIAKENDVKLASVLVQSSAVDLSDITEDHEVYSGSCMVVNGSAIVEGVYGFGDEFMVGDKQMEDLPEDVEETIKDLADSLLAVRYLPKSIEFEWVYDGMLFEVHIVQLNVGSVMKNQDVFIAGDMHEALEFDPKTQGMVGLKRIIKLARLSSLGIWVTSEISRTSHMAHLLIQSGVPCAIRK